MTPLITLALGCVVLEATVEQKHLNVSLHKQSAITAAFLKMTK